MSGDATSNECVPVTFYTLPNTLSSIFTLYLTLHDRNIGAKLPNDETIFELFADKSIRNKSLHFDEYQQFLVDFYEEEVAAMMMPNSEFIHVFSEGILRMSSESSLVQYSMLALSSRVLEQFSDQFQGEYTLDYYTIALEELSTVLRGEDKTLTEDARMHIIASAIMLGYFEVLSVDPSELASRFSNFFGFLKSLIPLKPNFAEIVIIESARLLQIMTFEFTNSVSVSDEDFATRTVMSPYSQIVGIVIKVERQIKLGCSEESWNQLWMELARWRSNLPGEYSSAINGSRESVFLSQQVLGSILLYFMAQLSLIHQKPVGIQVKETLNGISDESICILRNFMSWKNRFSVGNLFIAFHCIKKLLDTVKEKKVPMIEILKETEKWSHLVLLRWLLKGALLEQDKV
ncbi:hypothetical protein FOA43_003870 [Brettanomyces nanus]|uniref:Uncharacterized protein n=1 Tax=Eeniella nana TaxID=13502 RepID=A0A875S4A6_EENNA|nr:uncharacterized protein FOA43_003870 [Brettanomyces nanus]QPG76481.1 hypothetical protein FOA43_003870 [Brettanomyces nanus]